MTELAMVDIQIEGFEGDVTPLFDTVDDVKNHIMNGGASAAICGVEGGTAIWKDGDSYRGETHQLGKVTSVADTTDADAIFSWLDKQAAAIDVTTRQIRAAAGEGHQIAEEARIKRLTADAMSGDDAALHALLDELVKESRANLHSQVGKVGGQLVDVVFTGDIDEALAYFTEEGKVIVTGDDGCIVAYARDDDARYHVELCSHREVVASFDVEEKSTAIDKIRNLFPMTKDRPQQVQ